MKSLLELCHQVYKFWWGDRKGNGVIYRSNSKLSNLHYFYLFLYPLHFRRRGEKTQLLKLAKDFFSLSLLWNNLANCLSVILCLVYNENWYRKMTSFSKRSTSLADEAFNEIISEVNFDVSNRVTRNVADFCTRFVCTNWKRCCGIDLEFYRETLN